jgi:hypothetical protein
LEVTAQTAVFFRNHAKKNTRSDVLEQREGQRNGFVRAAAKLRHTMSSCAITCPLCGEPNDCQLAMTDAYKGPCWCVRETFPPDLLARVPEAARRVACVCRRCVLAAQSAEAHTRPLPRPRAGDFYIEGERVVFTAQYHRRRGYCCGSGCRHCPFDPLERGIALASISRKTNCPDVFG